MFKNEKEAYGQQEAETVIAASVRVEGDFVSQGNVRIEGAVSGSISTEADLFVGERAEITADVSAKNGMIAGEMRGNLKVTERLELGATARVYGDIQAKVLAVSPGAVMNGKVMIGENVAAQSGEQADKARPKLAARDKKIEEILTQQA